MGEKKTINMAWAINEGIREEMRRDPNVFLIGEDVATVGGPFGVTRGILDEFGPDRCKDTPISEQAIIGLAIGAAAGGLRPICEIMFMNFITLSMDQIYNQASKMRWMFGGQIKLPIVIRTMTAGGWGAGPHHSNTLEAWFAHMPGLKVVMPSTPYNAKGLIKAAIRDDNPVLYIEPLSLYRIKAEIPTDDYIVPIGKAEIVKEGSDLTIVSMGRMLDRAKKAAETLAQEGINAEVIDLLTVNPIDMETIYNSVKKTNRLIIIHEAPKICGVGAEIAAAVQEEVFDWLDAPVVRVAALFTHIAFQPTLEEAYMPQADEVVKKAKEMLGK